jgi:Zn-dependent peptidase ImmA (M78 family)
LLANPDFEGISLTNEKAIKLKKTLLPVLRLFKRENYTEIAVVENNEPFVGIYREFIIIFTSIILKNLSDQELRAAAAHELAHEVFMKEFESFVEKKDLKGQQEIENKCDLFAAQISLILKEDSLAIIKAVKNVQKLSKEANKIDTHGSADDREKILKVSLKLSKIS